MEEQLRWAPWHLSILVLDGAARGKSLCMKFNRGLCLHTRLMFLVSATWPPTDNLNTHTLSSWIVVLTLLNLIWYVKVSYFDIHPVILTCYYKRSFIFVFKSIFLYFCIWMLGDSQTFVSLFQNVLFCLSVFACCITLIFFCICKCVFLYFCTCMLYDTSRRWVGW